MKKKIEAKIIADSSNPDGTRLTTFVLTFPRIVLAEFNTHRVLSRNSASSRAIPYQKMIQMVKDDPFIPIKFQKDHSGMQGTEYFEGQDEKDCIEDWLAARDAALAATAAFRHDVTKQIRNRIVENYMWHTVIATGTDWGNFFALRAHEAAEIHIQELAYKMLEAYNGNAPTALHEGDWHIPFGDSFAPMRLDQLVASQNEVWSPKDAEMMIKRKISVARIARVSYSNFNGADDYEADVKLYDRLLEMGHMSPFEHIARVVSDHPVPGNFTGNWTQLRKMVMNENRVDARMAPYRIKPRA